MVKQSKYEARKRLASDNDNAILIAVANIAQQNQNYAGDAKSVMDRRDIIAERVLEALRRNWRVSERPRGERTT